MFVFVNCVYLYGTVHCINSINASVCVLFACVVNTHVKESNVCKKFFPVFFSLLHHFALQNCCFFFCLFFLYSKAWCRWFAIVFLIWKKTFANEIIIHETTCRSLIKASHEKCFKCIAHLIIFIKCVLVAPFFILIGSKIIEWKRKKFEFAGNSAK